MADRKIEPLFWIHPNFRLQFTYFSIKWYLIDHQVLVQEAMQGGRGKMVYQTQKNLMIIMLRDDHFGLDLLYSEGTQFKNLRYRAGCVSIYETRWSRGQTRCYHRDSMR